MSRSISRQARADSGLKSDSVYSGISAGDPDTAFEGPGQGMLDPFKTLARRCDEEIDIKLVRNRSH